MKRIPVLFGLLILGGALVFNAAAAERWYTVDITGGFVAANAGAGRVDLPALPDPFTDVVDLDPTKDPNVTVGAIFQLDEYPPPPGDWNAAGWWTFNFTGSSLSDWNDVFAGGNWTFTADWNGHLGNFPFENVHFGIPSRTFQNLYGKWNKNNSSVWTYFGMFFPPNTTNQSPTGIFAFVANDPLAHSDFDLEALYAAVDLNQGMPLPVSGSGRFEATPVPEPSMLILLGLGLGGACLAGSRIKKQE